LHSTSKQSSMDKKEFIKRVVPMGNWILKIAKRFLKNIEDARDISQDVFVRLWIVRPDLDQCNCIEAYANRTTQHLCINKLTKEKRERDALRDLVNEQEVISTPANSYDRKQIFLRIREIAEKLPPDKRDTFFLRDLDGLEYQEIADKYGMNAHWARVNISRARKQILEDAQKMKLYELYRD
jgi:RNA polymerase sigma-70 factor, ECF subfamily